MQIIKIIYFFFKSIIIGLFKRSYKPSFERINTRWYVDFKGWPSKFHNNLLVVGGTDRLLEYLGNHKPYVTLNISRKYKKGYLKVPRLEWSFLGGATYMFDDGKFKQEFWICPVTMFMFGCYPKYFYYKPEV